METAWNKVIQDREQAGRLLSNKLSFYRNTNTVVVGIPHGGVCVASSIAEALHLPLEIMPCRKIKHPAKADKDVGSVSPGEVFIHEFSRNIPQDYIYHQIMLLQNAIKYEQKFYYGPHPQMSFLYKTVILVDDVLKSSDAMISCIRAIRKQKPLKIIVAVPVVSAEAARTIRAEVEDMVFIRLEPSIGSGKDFFVDFPKVDKEKVQKIFRNSKRELLAA